MNRNVESHFSRLPAANIQRSVFDRSSSHKTSFNAGEIIPFYVDEVLPGDTFDVTTSKIVRSQTLLTPLMDNMYLDTYWFFVPNRLTWQHWEEFCGENKLGPWAQPVDYTIPTIGCPESGHFESGTLADYMGLPIRAFWDTTSALAPSALPFRAYALIINQFFRDENFSNPLLVPLDDANVVGSNAAPYGENADLSSCAKGGKPYLANKYHDYFTSALPEPQKGSAVSVPLPINGRVSTTDKVFAPPYTLPLLFGAPNSNQENVLTGIDDTSAVLSMRGSSYTPNSCLNYMHLGNEGPVWRQFMTFPAPGKDSIISQRSLVPLNLGLTDTSASFTINAFRLAYTYQCYLEAIARSGSRYGEMLQSIFGVTNPDSRLQHAEYLGGNRIAINVSEVTNTAQAEKDFLGDVGAKTLTSDVNHDFVKSFTEHGILMGLCVVRYDHSYSQGLERWWTRKKFLDFYNPKFANLGETPIYKAEIYAGDYRENQKTKVVSDPINNSRSTFGYQECWAEYRYKPSRVSGEMRPGVPNSLAFWHLADYYSTAPTLSESWLFEDKSNVDRALAVTSSAANQFWADFYIQNKCTRAMPMYSIPGLEPKF